MGAPYVIKRFVIGANRFVPIVAPVDCNYWAIYNKDASLVYFRYIKDDSDTEKELPAGMVETVLVPTIATAPRWLADSIIFYAKASTGYGPLVGTFIL